MEAHGGAISAESPVADGRGARFILTFPRKVARRECKIRVLVVDDEDAILRFLKPALEANNYEMTSTGTVTDAVKRVAAETPDIVLLDLGLPDGDGKDVIRRCREWSDVPIIVLSARDREVEKIEALDLGADDYVNKPFNVGELLARMRTALRHRMQRKAEIPVLRVGGLEIDAVRHRATRAGAELKLTPKEFELLSFLAKHAGRVITHKQILAAVWGPAHVEDTQYLRVYIGQLRQKDGEAESRCQQADADSDAPEFRARQQLFGRHQDGQRGDPAQIHHGNRKQQQHECGAAAHAEQAVAQAHDHGAGAPSRHSLRIKPSGERQ